MDGREFARTDESFSAIRPSTIVIVLNPASGRGRGERQRPALEALLERVSRRQLAPSVWRIVETTGAGSGEKLAAEAVRQGAQIVAAAGGDGTLGEVANGLIGTGATLAVLPMGTGNDFARYLGLGNDLQRAVETLFFGIPRWVDVGREHCGRRFINIAGGGFDAVVANRVNRGYRLLRGTAAYLAAVFETLIRFRPVPMRITIDGEVRELQAMLCAVANSRSYGGGMNIAPDARIDDGLFDICILGAAGKLEFILAFPRVFKGTHTTHPKVSMLRGKRVRLETDPPLPVLLDGEVRGLTPVEFTIEPGALPVLMPVPAQTTGRKSLYDGSQE
jgi:diacylglycerol kinase (ATP)